MLIAVLALHSVATLRSLGERPAGVED